MAETQKAKIARLEKELSDAHTALEKLRQELYHLQTLADEEFEKSPCFRQLKRENEALKSHIKILESRLSNAAKKSDQQIEIIEKLQRELEKERKSQ